MSNHKNKKIKIISQCKMIKMKKNKLISQCQIIKMKKNSKKNLKNIEPKPGKLLKLVNRVMTTWLPYKRQK